MGMAFKGVPNGKGGILWDWQSVGRGKLRANVTPHVAGHLGVVFQPEHKAFFQLATERLFDRGSRAHLEAGNPPRNGATCNVEQIDAFDSRCNHQYPSDESGFTRYSPLMNCLDVPV